MCGADEMILTSRDGGATWETKHQNRDGEVLLNISFVDEKTGCAAGTGGLLLSTVDEGQTWKSHQVPESVRNFSFADPANGIAVVSSSAHQPKDGLPVGMTSVADSATARFSTCVISEGTLIRMRGCTSVLRCCAFWMK